MGLGAVFAPLSYTRILPESDYGFMRASRNTLAADVDNDGRPDLVNNVYWCNGDAENTAQLYLQNADGTFRRDVAFETANPVRGWGETIVAADFDNDGFLDLYFPAYTRPDGYSQSLAFCGRFAAANTPGRSWLLMNRGAAQPGSFRTVPRTPVTLTMGDCGSDCINSGSLLEPYAQPEGAQAIDYDEDGNVDLFVNGILFRNGGQATFARVFPPPGVVPAFDEGAKFIDWNNDGYPDLVYVEPYSGIVHLFAWRGGMRDSSGRVIAGQLTEDLDPAVVGAFTAHAVIGSFGMNAGDVNGDGYDDVILNGSVVDFVPKVYLNSGPPTYAFRLATLAGVVGLAGLRSSRDGMQVGDLNGDGQPDLIIPDQWGNRTTRVFFNVTPSPMPLRLVIDVLGDFNGRAVRNQQGRVVHVTPAANASFSYTRYVDGGSGYMSQSAYPVTVHTAFAGSHTITVRYADGFVSCTATPPAYVTVRQHANPPCESAPLPAAYPLPHGHEIRAIAPALDLVLDEPTPTATPAAVPCVKPRVAGGDTVRPPAPCRSAPPG